MFKTLYFHNAKHYTINNEFEVKIMNYVYLIAGIVIGFVFIGMGKNTKKRKAIPYEVTKKLKSNKHMDEYNIWCDTESSANYTIGCSLIIFGISATFMDNNRLIGNILALISLILFVFGYFKKIINNKKRLNHFFVR